MSLEVASGIRQTRREAIPSAASATAGAAFSSVSRTFFLSERSCIGVHVCGITARNIPETSIPFAERILEAIPPASPGDAPQVTATYA